MQRIFVLLSNVQFGFIFIVQWSALLFLLLFVQNEIFLNILKAWKETMNLWIVVNHICLLNTFHNQAVACQFNWINSI